MSLTLSQVLSVATIAQWEAQLLSYASGLGLTATAWQPGGIARTIFAVFARALNSEDQITYDIAAGGFLDTASAITPEGGPGWLDLVAQYNFAVTREPATQGSSTVTITNTGAPIGPLPVGTYHLQASSGNTYRNSTVITLATGATTMPILCDQFGETDGAGTAMTPITTYSGVSSSTLTTAAVGSSAETNANLIARCKLKLAALAPKLGGQSSYQYFVLTTTEAGYPTLSGAITRVRVSANPVTGRVLVYIATSSGAPAGGDVTLLQAYLDAVATPDGETMSVIGATDAPITVGMDVWCPAAYATQIVTDVGAAVGAFFAQLPIGGEYCEDIATTGVSYNALEDYVARAVPYLRTQSSTLNGGTLSIPLAVYEVATSVAVTVTYMGE